jgi:Zn-dependent peptidase ImmA (M78 family)
MKNPQVGNSEKRLIEKAVRRLLLDMKGVEPPLDLSAVRTQLRLDLEYYSSKDPGLVKEIVHSIKVAGKEMLSSKTMLGRMIDKLRLRGMLFWDQNRILIDSDLHHVKHRWAEGHEIGHKLSSWHKHYLLGDSKNELSPTCHATIEAEANYAASQLLFLQDRFVAEAMSLPVSMDSLKVLRQRFGNSNASTLWRMVEQYAGSHPLLGIVSEHPHRLPADFDHAAPCRYVIESSAFRAKFSNTTEVQLFDILTAVCNRKSGGPLGTEEVQLTDNNGDRHEFVFETFCFKYKQSDGSVGFQVLTLGVYKRALSRVIVAGSTATD